MLICNVNKSPVADPDMVVRTTVTSRSSSPIRSTHTITVFPFPDASSSITLYIIWAKPILTTGLWRRMSQGGKSKKRGGEGVVYVFKLHPLLCNIINAKIPNKGFYGTDY